MTLVISKMGGGGVGSRLLWCFVQILFLKQPFRIIAEPPNQNRNSHINISVCSYPIFFRELGAAYPCDELLRPLRWNSCSLLLWVLIWKLYSFALKTHLFVHLSSMVNTHLFSCPIHVSIKIHLSVKVMKCTKLTSISTKISKLDGDSASLLNWNNWCVPKVLSLWKY